MRLCVLICVFSICIVYSVHLLREGHLQARAMEQENEIVRIEFQARASSDQGEWH